MNNNININPEPLKSDHRDTFTLDRPFILTQDKMLVTGMPYMYSEGNRTTAVRLVNVWNDYDMEDEFVYLTLQELQTNRTFTLSWNLNFSGSYYLWSLADLPILMNTKETD